MAGDTRVVLDLDKVQAEIEEARRRSDEGDINYAAGTLTACALLLLDEARHLRAETERLRHLEDTTRSIVEKAQHIRDLWPRAGTPSGSAELQNALAALANIIDTRRAAIDALPPRTEEATDGQ